MILNIRARKGAMLPALLILLICSLICFANPAPAQAADFGYSGLGNIVCMWQTPEGFVRAMDRNGVVAEFNYVEWKRVNNGFGSLPAEKGYGIYLSQVTADYDKAINKVILKYNYWNCYSYRPRDERLCFIKVYDAGRNSWSGEMTYDNYWNGKYYKVIDKYNQRGDKRDIGLQEFDLNGNLLDTVWYRPEDEDLEDYYVITSISDRYIVLCSKVKHQNVHGGRIVILDLQTKQFYLKKDSATKHKCAAYEGVLYIGYLDHNYSYCIDKMTPDGNWHNVKSWYVRDWNDKNVYFYTNNNVGLVAAVSHTKEVYFNQNKINFSNAPFLPKGAICYDRFGNMVVSGGSGRVCVRAPSGVTTTNSNFYTDYLLAWSNEAAVEAQKAAEEAKKASQANSEQLKEINNRVENLENKLTGQPIINSVSGVNGATAGRGSINLNINASGVTHYKAGTAPGSGQSYLINENATVPLTSGANTIYVEAWHEKNPDNIAVARLTAFGL